MPHVMLQTQPTISKNVANCSSAETMLRRQATNGRLILVVVPQQNTLNADNSVPAHTHGRRSVDLSRLSHENFVEFIYSRHSPSLNYQSNNNDDDNH